MTHSVYNKNNDLVELDGPLPTNLDYARRVLLAYLKEMRPHYIGGIFTSLIFIAFVFHSLASKQAMQVWYVLHICFAISVLVFELAYAKYQNKIAFECWKKLSLLPLWFYLCPLVAAPWVFLTDSIDVYAYTMLVILISLTGTTAYALCYYLHRHTLFLLLPMASLIAKLSLMNGMSIWFYLIIGFLSLSSFLFSFHINKNLLRSINLQLENAKERLLAEKANKEKSRFMAAASHDIRQPVQSINLLVESLKQRDKNNSNQEIYKHLEESTQNIANLVNSLLNITRLESNEIKPQKRHFDTASVISKLQYQLSALAVQKGLAFKLDTSSNILYADPILLEQALSNLLTNAIKYTEAGKVELTIKEKVEKLCFEITDTGCGIPVKEHEQVFQEFYQLQNSERDSAKGLGLGLAIVKRICDLQGWTLNLTSIENQGSTFILSGQKGDKTKVKTKSSITQSDALQGKSVLVIDDHESIRVSLQTTLSEWGCSVLCFDAAKPACDHLVEHANTVDVIISDYRLRDGKNGPNAIRALQKIVGETTPAIILTGDIEISKQTELKQEDWLVLYKPIKPAKLRLAIQRLLED